MSKLIDVLPAALSPDEAELLENSLISFSEIARIPVTFFSMKGDVLWEYNRERKVCISNKTYYRRNSPCSRLIQQNIGIAATLGEVYTSLCESDVVSLTYVYRAAGRAAGAFVAGPVLMGIDRNRVITNFFERIPRESIDFPVLLGTMDNIHTYDPREVYFLSTLFSNVLCPGTPAHHEQNMEQSDISRRIHTMKRQGKRQDYPLKEEQALLEHVRSGDRTEALSCFSRYMDALMVYENGDLPLIRLRLIIMLSGLLHHSSSETYSRYLPLLDRMASIDTVRGLLMDARELIGQLVQDSAGSLDSGSSELIRQAADYIREHYCEPLSLDTLAEALHCNKTYLSSAFKRTTGKGIAEYIRDLRLDRTARELTDTNRSITDIALSCGFETVSYFARLFRERFGLTPSQYRKERP